MQDRESLVDKVKSYINQRMETKLEAFDKAAEKRRTATSDAERQGVEAALLEERRVLEQQYQVQNWLTDAAKRAGQISMMTHAPKYTHSDTRSMGVFLRNSNDQANNEPQRLLHSLALDDLAIDVGGNAAALDVARLLMLDAEGVKLLDEIAAGDSQTLKSLAVDESQYQEWMQGLGAALQDKELKSGQLSKQLYFPVEEGYHLLSPLYASSLSQKLYDKLTESFYSETAKAARDAKKKQKHHTDEAVYYPNIAIQSYGGTKPQNISQLNTSRYGRGYLLPSHPPSWESKVALPTGSKHSFWNEYDSRVWRIARVLRIYLEGIYHQTSTIDRREQRAELVDELIDILLIYAAEIQQLRDQRGWTTDSQLSRAEQLWLDPYRQEIDENFKAEREMNDWQEDIARQFAAWLNNKLSFKSDTLYTGDPEFKEWKKLLERKLRLLREDLEVSV